jgi:hypothetical protein
MAGNLGVTDRVEVDEDEDGDGDEEGKGKGKVVKGKVVLIGDATACWRKPEGG